MAKKVKNLENTGPWLSAQREWNTFTGNVMGAKTLWQIVALFSLIIALAAVGGMISLSQKSKFVPYVVEVDKLGEAFAVKRADVAAPVDERVMRYTLARWIADVRTVSFDLRVMNDATWRAYSMMQSEAPANAKLTEYMRDPVFSPINRAKRVTVAINISTILQQSAKTWEITWEETAYNRQNGQKLETIPMRAVLMTEIIPPTNLTPEEEVQRNPLGIYVNDFSWSVVNANNSANTETVK